MQPLKASEPRVVRPFESVRERIIVQPENALEWMEVRESGSLSELSLTQRLKASVATQVKLSGSPREVS